MSRHITAVSSSLAAKRIHTYICPEFIYQRLAVCLESEKKKKKKKKKLSGHDRIYSGCCPVSDGLNLNFKTRRSFRTIHVPQLQQTVERGRLYTS